MLSNQPLLSSIKCGPTVAPITNWRYTTTFMAKRLLDMVISILECLDMVISILECLDTVIIICECLETVRSIFQQLDVVISPT